MFYLIRKYFFYLYIWIVAEGAVISELIRQDRIKVNEGIILKIFSNITCAGFKYQISVPLLPAFKKGVFQDIFVCAYRK